ncbi:2-oxo-4-hydroxy-4-carboxy-5-ureidoimidazoline decarboxylase [Pristis pectinata]|uniref:2-oxo-4-hydroxy-4-carboxy-5-ureidoimidazoline decarboxylase n=1 Tax=Pristis pectinata TaxID=685728 RepID=UPI00223D6D8B|nr:2-oxo-4-hydroxy-4-carboxy-5-ureidoimidazoline decarboxylase [Pristis pectinata]
MEIQVFNSMDYEEFVDKFGNVIEKCPLVAAAVWTNRPFTSLAALEKMFGDFIDLLPPSGKEGILRCHPDLAGRDLLRGTLSSESQGEQIQAGLTNLTVAQRSQLSELNASYKNRFHFPFVICARMNDKDTIIKQLSSRIHNSPEHELNTSIAEVKKICHLRLLDILNRVPHGTKL